MKSYSYRERDYAFGQLMLTLRTTLGLTQAGLAEPLGVSRRAVAEWEGGLSYPKAERLKAFIALCVQQHAFAAGREEEEIRALWKAARQKVLLDEDWLRGLLAPAAPVRLSPPAGTPAAHAGAEAVAFPRVDWVGALDVSHFAGREVEVAELSQWIVQGRCRLGSQRAGRWGKRDGCSRSEQVTQPGFIQQHLLVRRLPQRADLLLLTPGGKGLLLHCQGNELFEVVGFGITTAGLPAGDGAPVDMQHLRQAGLGQADPHAQAQHQLAEGIVSLMVRESLHERPPHLS